MSRTGNLIDLSPPNSGASTPRSHTSGQAHGQGAAANYGIGTAISGLWRRLSALDQHAEPQLPSLTSWMGNTGDGINGAFTPPRRVATPRGLPSLEPLNLKGYHDDTDQDERLLSRAIAEEIRTFVPERLKICEDWTLIYSLYQNGSSLSTLYKVCEDFIGERAGFVLVVRDGKGSTFGAYLSEAPHPSTSYFGTGETFLWRASVHAPLPPPPSADTDHLTSLRSTTIGGNGMLSPSPTTLPGPSIRFQTFAYSGANDYCMFCEQKFLSVGGGSGTYGLWLNDELSRGRSAECDTFLNQPLSEEGEKFDIVGVELWAVGAG